MNKQRVILGAAQFGLNYGISNKNGKIDKVNVSEILNHAYCNNVSMIDTASLYGCSEEAIGSSVDIGQNWKIVTKTPRFFGNSINNSHVKQLKDTFFQSLFHLNLKKIYGLLVHSCDDLLKPGGFMLFNEMERLKSRGLVGKIGVSVYNERQINEVLKSFPIDLIQVPVNILDQNIILNGSLKKLKKHGVEIHARSIFLQGLLLMDKHLVPPYFVPIKSQLNMFNIMAKDLSITKLELALGFVENISEIDKIIVGVGNLNQFIEIINATKLKINLKDCADISVNNPKYTNPSLWKI